MVLKWLPDKFNPLSKYVIHNNKELMFTEFKTQLLSFKDSKKYRLNWNVMKNNLFIFENNK